MEGSSLIVVLNDGETYSGIDGCAIFEVPQGLEEERDGLEGPLADDELKKVRDLTEDQENVLFDFTRISEAAKKQNGWDIRGVYQLTEVSEHRDMATGVVVFERGDATDSGTAAVNVHPDGSVEFYWGHYDLSMVQSREDFADRITRGR